MRCTDGGPSLPSSVSAAFDPCAAAALPSLDALSMIVELLCKGNVQKQIVCSGCDVLGGMTAAMLPVSAGV